MPKPLDRQSRLQNPTDQQQNTTNPVVPSFPSSLPSSSDSDPESSSSSSGSESSESAVRERSRQKKHKPKYKGIKSPHHPLHRFEPQRMGRLETRDGEATHAETGRGSRRATRSRNGASSWRGWRARSKEVKTPPQTCIAVTTQPDTEPRNLLLLPLFPLLDQKRPTRKRWQRFGLRFLSPELKRQFQTAHIKIPKSRSTLWITQVRRNLRFIETPEDHGFHPRLYWKLCRCSFGRMRNNSHLIEALT